VNVNLGVYHEKVRLIVTNGVPVAPPTILSSYPNLTYPVQLEMAINVAENLEKLEIICIQIKSCIRKAHDICVDLDRLLIRL